MAFPVWRRDDHRLWARLLLRPIGKARMLDRFVIFRCPGCGAYHVTEELVDHADGCTGELHRLTVVPIRCSSLDGQLVNEWRVTRRETTETAGVAATAGRSRFAEPQGTLPSAPIH